MRTATQVITIASTLALVAGCSFGRVRPAASGMSIVATAPSGQVRAGELLATPDSGVVFLDERERIVFTRFSAGIELRNAFEDTRPPKVRITGQPDAGDLGKLRFHSRYPLGVADDTLMRLMSTLGQSQPEVWP